MIIRAYFGLAKNPFCPEPIKLMSHQEDIFQIVMVHSQQGGLCLILGEPWTGKSTIKSALAGHDPKRLHCAMVSRTMHTYCNTLRILCQSFDIEFDGGDNRCEKRLINHAFALNAERKMIVTIIDDAHLLDIHCLRKLRLLFEEFPKNHNLVLIAQPALLGVLGLAPNADLHSRVTYSVNVPRMNPDQIETYILGQLDECGLGHNTLDIEALGLIVRSADGIVRHARNLCISSLIEAARSQSRSVELSHVNRVLIQPHWRNHRDIEMQRRETVVADATRSRS